MSFPFNIYVLAVLGGFGVTFATLPLWVRVCKRVGLVDDPGHRKIHSDPMPLAGGLAVLSGILVPLVAGIAIALAPSGIFGQAFSGFNDFKVADLMAHGLSRRSLELAGILFGAAGMAGLGLLDDRYELRPALKFTGQFLIAALTAAAGVRVTLFVDSLFFSYAVTILWILTVTNALNFMDNMNGLCAGLGLVGAFLIGVFAMTQVHYLVASISFLVFGAVLGFLPYNFPRAKTFLGDSGSHLVGYLLAVLAILPHFYSVRNPQQWAVLMPLLVLAVPLGDLGWVVVLRWRMGKPFYIGDTNHLSHRLVRRGLSPTLAVLSIWLLAAAVGAVSFLTLLY